MLQKTPFKSKTILILGNTKLSYVTQAMNTWMHIKISYVSWLVNISYWSVKYHLPDSSNNLRLTWSISCFNY